MAYAVTNAGNRSKCNDHFVSVVAREILTIKAPITTAADDIGKYYFIVFQRK